MCRSWRIIKQMLGIKGLNTWEEQRRSTLVDGLYSLNRIFSATNLFLQKILGQLKMNLLVMCSSCLFLILNVVVQCVSSSPSYHVHGLSMRRRMMGTRLFIWPHLTITWKSPSCLSNRFVRFIFSWFKIVLNLLTLSYRNCWSPQYTECLSLVTVAQ